MSNFAELLSPRAGAEILPANYSAPLDLESIFGRIAPLEVDLGCGDGSFLAAAAVENPDRNFLGIERLAGRVRTACRKIERAALMNARILRLETSYAVREMLPAGSVDVFHLMFPDPWPKRRHHNRRIVTGAFLGSLYRALAPNGRVRIATDQLDYYAEIERLISKVPQFFAHAADAKTSPHYSTFEKRFAGNGTAIHRLVLRKVSDVI